MRRSAPELLSARFARVDRLLGRGFFQLDERASYTARMLVRYIDTALRRARYRQMDDDSFCATVPGLRGVVAIGRTVEACRDQLAQVVEEWVLIRIARGLKVPPLGGARVEVKQAS